jgi:TrmH family RNA methyltransferase
MSMITSPHNHRLKELRKLQRRRERERSGRFLAEGEDLIAAARAAGRPAVEGYRAAGTGIGGSSFDDVEESVLSSVSTLGSGTRAIGVYEQRFTKPVGPLCVYLHGVSDPGNVGAVLRSALAFGASCVALGPGCADPHSPKAVRSSMGAIFAMGLAQVRQASELPGARVGLVAGVGEPIWDVLDGLGLRRGIVEVPAGIDGSAEVGESAADGLPDVRLEARPSDGHKSGGLTLLVGAERDGLPEEIVEACDSVAHIPIASDSLNAAMAATVALYEMTRSSTRVPAS